MAENCSFEEVVYLLLNHRLPTKSELADLRSKLVSEMNLPDPLMEWFGRISKELHPMVILRSAVSDLALYDPEPNDNSLQATHRKAIRLVAKIPVLLRRCIVACKANSCWMSIRPEESRPIFFACIWVKIQPRAKLKSWT